MLSLIFLTLSAESNAQTALAPADTATLKAYIGTYSFASDSPVQKFTVTTNKGDLFGEADEHGKNKLLKQATADTFKSTSSYGSVITFVRDAATKAVTGFTMAI